MPMGLGDVKGTTLLRLVCSPGDPAKPLKYCASTKHITVDVVGSGKY